MVLLFFLSQVLLKVVSPNMRDRTNEVPHTFDQGGTQHETTRKRDRAKSIKR